MVGSAFSDLNDTRVTLEWHSPINHATPASSFGGATLPLLREIALREGRLHEAGFAEVGRSAPLHVRSW